MVLLDTDICIEYLRGNDSVVGQVRNRKEQLAISFMTLGELYYGAYNSLIVDYQLSQLNKLSFIITVIYADQAICKSFGIIKSFLRKKGNLIPDADILIAVTAIEKTGVLITGNTKHFDRISEFGLNIENWLHGHE